MHPRRLPSGLQRFFGHEIAGRTAQEPGDLVDMVEVVFDLVLRAFRHADKTFRYADAESQHGLRHTLGHALPADGFNYIYIDRRFHAAAFFDTKLKNVPLVLVCYT